MTESLHKGPTRLLLPYVLAAGMIIPAGNLHAQTTPITARNTSIVVQSGGTVNITGGFTVLKDVDINCNGLWQSGGGVTLYTGNNNNSAGGSGAIRLWTLEMAKTQPVTLTLESGLQIGNALNFQRGLIELNGQELRLDSAALLNGENDQSRITGINGGKAVALLNGVNAPNQLNIGNLGAMLTSPADLGSLTVSRSQVPAVSGDIGIQRTYFIQPQNNETLDATLRFYYLNAELNGNDPGKLDLWKSTDGIAWALIGADTRDTVNHYVEKAGIADLSYWTLANISNPLPLVLVSFSAICAGNYAVIEWKTGVESKLNDFLVQRSLDGQHWSTLGSVVAENAAEGTSYSFKDVTPQADCFYRLEIVNQDGSVSYSPVFHGGCSDIALPFLVYPNPAVSQAVVQVSLRESVTGKLQVLTISGQPVYEAAWSLQPGLNQLVIPVSNWAPGSYILRLVLPGGIQQANLIKL
jgi:hypothetical protein